MLACNPFNFEWFTFTRHFIFKLMKEIFKGVWFCPQFLVVLSVLFFTSYERQLMWVRQDEIQFGELPRNRGQYTKLSFPRVVTGKLSVAIMNKLIILCYLRIKKWVFHLGKFSLHELINDIGAISDFLNATFWIRLPALIFFHSTGFAICLHGYVHIT